MIRHPLRAAHVPVSPLPLTCGRFGASIENKTKPAALRDWPRLGDEDVGVVVRTTVVLEKVGEAFLGSPEGALAHPRQLGPVMLAQAAGTRGDVECQKEARLSCSATMSPRVVPSPSASGSSSETGRAA